MNRAHAPINAVAWLLWLSASVALPLVSRNPLYLGLALLVAGVVYLSLPRSGTTARAWRLFVLVGLSLTALSVVFNVLTVHVGEAAFAELPAWLPIIGGKLTWNAFAYGLVRALAIAVLLVSAGAFNTAVRHGDLVRLLPGSLARLGIAGNIALTMVPQTVAAGKDIIDAQRTRGVRLDGARAAGSIIVPLLSVGLERAITLSEALEVRGFGASVEVPESAARRWWLVPAAVALIVALAALGLGRLWLGMLALGVALALALRSAPGGMQRTRLRKVQWSRASAVVAGGAVFTLTLLLVGTLLLGESLAWDPFPRLVAPAFSPVIGVALLGLLVPAVAQGGRQ